MSAVEFWAVFALATVLIVYITHLAWQEKRQVAWDQHIESIVTDTNLYPGDETPIHTELLCEYEAARFDPDHLDWSQPAAWKETR